MDKQILIIDDERAIREMLHFSLRGENFTVLDAPDCATALKILAQQRPDLILLDWMLLIRIKYCWSIALNLITFFGLRLT